jgi:hypothetical protein
MSASYLAITALLAAAPVTRVEITRFEALVESEADALEARRLVEAEIAAAGLTLADCAGDCATLEVAVLDLAGGTSVAVKVIDDSGQERSVVTDDLLPGVGLPSLRAALVLLVPPPPPFSPSAWTVSGLAASVALGVLAGVAQGISAQKEADFEAHLDPEGTVRGLSRDDAGALEDAARGWAWVRNGALIGAAAGLLAGGVSLAYDLAEAE